MFGLSVSCRISYLGEWSPSFEWSPSVAMGVMGAVGWAWVVVVVCAQVVGVAGQVPGGCSFKTPTGAQVR